MMIGTDFNYNMSFLPQNKKSEGHFALPYKNDTGSSKVFYNQVFNHFNAIKNYNIPFLGLSAKEKEAKSAIYAIDAYKNFKKFDNAFEAASAFNIGANSILRCARGDSESAGDFIFAFADSVEETGRGGKKVPDTVIINLASEVLCSIAANKTVPLSIDDALEMKVKSKTAAQKVADTQKQCARINAAVYAIDRNGRYEKYPKVQDLLDSLDVSKASVYKCLRKEKDNVNGIVFCYDFDVETMDENGNVVPSSRLIRNKIRSLKNSDVNITLDLLILRKKGDKHISSGAKTDGVLGTISDEDLTNTQLRYLQKPFYVVDKEGNYRKFYLQKHVAEALGMHKEQISDYLQKRSKPTGDYTFVYASEVEKVDKNGCVTVQIDKLTGADKQETGFYLVDKDGNFTKFETIEEAHQCLGISYNNLLSCILGRQEKTSDFAFIKAKDFEIKNEHGVVFADQEKLDELVGLLNKNAVYLIDENGNYSRYESRAQAGRAIGVSGQDITAAVSGRKRTIHGYVAVDANEIEQGIGNEDKQAISLKIKEALALSKEKRSIDVSKNGFYAIDKNANCKKFFDISQARKELNIQYNSILNCLLGVDKTAKGYVFALAEDVENQAEDGTVSVDKAKILQKAAVFESKAVYAISKDGRCTRYSNQKEASDALEIPLVNVSRCINKTIKETYGCSFLFASEVEIDTTGEKPVLDEALIQEKVNYLNRNALYVIKRDGTYQRYEDRALAEKALGVNKASIGACLNGKYNTCHDMVFAFPWEVEIKNEEGETVADKNKIKEKMKLFKRGGSK